MITGPMPGPDGLPRCPWCRQPRNIADASATRAERDQPTLRRSRCRLSCRSRLDAPGSVGVPERVARNTEPRRRQTQSGGTEPGNHRRTVVVPCLPNRETLMRRVGAINQLVSALAYRRRYVHGRRVPADELQRSDDLGPWQRTLIPRSAPPWAILVELPATRRRAPGEIPGYANSAPRMPMMLRHNP
jgi:hypothetical protein